MFSLNESVIQTLLELGMHRMFGNRNCLAENRKKKSSNAANVANNVCKVEAFKTVRERCKKAPTSRVCLVLHLHLMSPVNGGCCCYCMMIEIVKWPYLENRMQNVVFLYMHGLHVFWQRCTSSRHQGTMRLNRVTPQLLSKNFFFKFYKAWMFPNS